MAEVEPEHLEIGADRCPRCGQHITRKEEGRPPIWCSQTCRRAAYEERRAAASGAIAVRVVDRVVVRNLPHDTGDCIAAVVTSPEASSVVITVLGRFLIGEDWVSSPRWKPAVEALATLAESVVRVGLHGPLR